MKKTLYLVMVILLACFLFVNCIGSPKPTVERIDVDSGTNTDSPPPQDNGNNDPPPPPPAQMEDMVIIDHKTKDFGGQVPDWCTLSPIDIESQDKYKEYYVFIIDHIGKDLNGLKLWARNFSAASEISRMISTRVKDKFVGAAVGDMDMLETYMEEVVASVSESSFSGVRNAGDFWVKKQDKNNPNHIEFRYILMVIVPQTEVGVSIDRAFDDANHNNSAKTEDEQTAIDRVEDAFSDGL